jgi:hypothetical protein
MFSLYVFIKILGFCPKGTGLIFKNIEKLPKGTSFREGDRFFIGASQRGKAEGGRGKLWLQSKKRSVKGHSESSLAR